MSMEPLVSTRAVHRRFSCAQRLRPGRAGALLRELARTPFIGRLLLSREPAPAAALPVLVLPESLLASVFGFAGLPSALSVSLTSRAAYAQLWQSPFFWRTLLQALGASNAALATVALDSQACQPGHKGEGRHASARALRDFARHWLLGIDLLAGARLQPAGPRGLGLDGARRAVLALRPEDGAAPIRRAAESLASLLRSQATMEDEVLKAEKLLEAVAARSDLFTTAQMLDILGAHQEAAPEPPDLGAAPKPPRRQALATPGSPQRPSRKERRQARASAAAAA